MCFSPAASFTASALLTSSGLLAQKKVTDKKLRLLAGIPLLFAAQQFFEGIVWLTHTSNPHIAQFGAYGFLFFAFIFWPVWIPLSLLPVEKKPTRTLLLKGSLVLGAVFAALAVWYLLTHTLNIRVINCSIAYTFNETTAYDVLIRLWYLCAALAPFFISSFKKMWIVGLAIFIGYEIADIVYTQTFISVWCFFAAVISGLVVWVVMKNK